MPPQNPNAAKYWNAQLHRMKIETDKLQWTIWEGKRTESFVIMQTIENTLSALRASLRENMTEEDKTM